MDINDDLSVESSLNDYFLAEELDDYKIGKKYAEASTKWHIIKSPNILLLHIKRFYFDEGWLYKEDCDVSYPEILQIKKEFMCEESKDQ